MKLVGGERTESWWLYAIAGALMLAGPLWRALFANGYPMRPEVFVLLLLAASVGAVVASGSRYAGGLAGTVIFGGLLFIFVDLQFDLHSSIPTAYLLAASLALALVLTSHRAAITSLALGAFYLSSLIRPGASIVTRATEPESPAAGRPLLVHVILDEQWGVGGFRAAGDTATAIFLADFYLSRGFELYEAAYSRYEETRESIPLTLSLGDSLSFGTDVTDGGKGYLWRMRRNPYFEKLQALGYDIRVYQSKFLDLCADTSVTLRSCDAQAGNSIANIGFLDGNWTTRGMWAARYFLNTRSHVYARLNPERTIWRRSVVGGAVANLRRLTSNLAVHPEAGTAWFVHVLIPHRPVQVNATCRILENPADMIGYDLPVNLDDSKWRAALGLYAGQVRCGHQLLGEVLDAIDGTVGRDKSIVIVHGDHGSRMQRRQRSADWPATFEADQLNAAFSTLLAIRRPGVPPVVHGEPTPVQDFIWELARGGFEGTLSREWQHAIRGKPDSLHANGLVVPLVPANTSWARQPH